VLRLIVLLAAAGSIAAGPVQTQKPAPPPPPANVAGKWIITLVMSRGTGTPARSSSSRMARR
jgi:hypothetical protein